MRVRRFSNDFIQSVIMLTVLLYNDKKMNKEAYISWGFVGLDNDIIDISQISRQGFIRSIIRR